MKNLLVIAFALCSFGCLPPVGQECSQDLDCKGSRICVDGECQSPGGDDDTDGPDPIDEAPTCGELVIDCNCGPTSAPSPGYAEPDSSCDSGAHIVDVCGTCPNGYAAWYAVCAC